MSAASIVVLAITKTRTRRWLQSLSADPNGDYLRSKRRRHVHPVQEDNRDDQDENPDAILDEWPTPGTMIFGRPSRNIPPLVSGSRREVLKEMYLSEELD